MQEHWKQPLQPLFWQKIPVSTFKNLIWFLSGIRCLVRHMGETIQHIFSRLFSTNFTKAQKKKNNRYLTTGAVVQRHSVKKVFLQILQNSQENTCARVFFLIKLLADTDNFIKKETLAQVFFCEFYKIFKNTFSCRKTPVAASNFY